MPNKFQNIQDFGGANISASQDNIPDIDASDCDSMDFSLDGLMSVNSGKTSVGLERVGFTGEGGEMFLFKKSFGTIKEILVKTRYVSGNKRIEWFNNNLSLANYGQWERLSMTNFSGTAKFGFAIGNGDTNKLVNRLFMGNGVQDMMFWNGATTTLSASSCTSTTIATAATNLLTEGFELNPYGVANKIIINGTEFTYTGISTNTFTGVTPDPTTLITSGDIKQGDGVCQSANERLMDQATIQSYKIQFNQVGLTGNNVTRTDTSIDFSTAGFQLGQRVFVTGFATSGNNKVYTIKTITATTITFDDNEVGEASEAAGKLITVSAGVPKGNILQVDNGKLYVSGVIGDENTMHYSVTNDLTNFTITTDSKLTDGGYYTFFQGGNNITAIYPRGNNKVIVHKTDGIFSYNLNVDSSNKVYATVDILSLGSGVGARNNESITSYDKSIYYFNVAGELKMMEQSVYNTSTFNFDTIVGQLKYMAISGNTYLIYDNKKSRLVLSCNVTRFNLAGLNYLISVYIKKTSQGNSYKTSFDQIPLQSSGNNVSSTLPIVYTSRESFTPYGLFLYISKTTNTYIWGGSVSTTSNSKPYWVSKEFTFGEPAQGKEFDIVNIDGYLYGDTKVRITILYGSNGKDGSKHYVFDKNTLNEDSVSIIDDVIVSDKNYGLLGYNSIFNSYDLFRYGYANYFKIPLHIDIKKSDRYKIRIETYAPTSSDLTNTWWAINNISTNPSLKDVNMLELINQNEVDGEGIGSMIIGSTNIVA